MYHPKFRNSFAIKRRVSETGFGSTWIDCRVLLRRLCKDLQIPNSDRDYLCKRLRHEGVRFLTLVLPAYSKFVLRSLEARAIQPRSTLTNFHWSGSLPVLFRGLISELFDPKGRAIKDGNPLSLWRIRQLCEYFYKLAFTFEDHEISSSVEKYTALEQELPRYTDLDFEWINKLQRNLRHYPLFTQSTLERYLGDSRPRFGPGAFYGSELNSIPYYVWKQLPDSVTGTTRDDFRQISGYFRPYPSCKTPVRLVHEGKVSKLCFVPKDARGPRTISKEPMHLLRVQMAFFDSAISYLSRDTSGSIEFLDQSGNRELAKKSSADRSLATLDLKDASDRVSFHLLYRLFEYCPGLRWFITKARSTHTELPTGELLPLKKLSGMGSGLTFPIMAFLIHLSVCTEIQSRTGANYRDIVPLVRVYGDDLIVPSAYYTEAVNGLTRTGFVINTDKSFIHGFFRESCGGDYFGGSEVTPVRLKLTGCKLGTPREYRDVLPIEGGLAITQLERHARELYRSGLIETAESVYLQLEKAVGPLPHVSGNSPFLGRYTFYQSSIPDDYVKAVIPLPRVLRADVCPYKHLSRFLSPTREDVLDGVTYGELAIPRTIKLKRRQVSGAHLRGVSQT